MIRINLLPVRAAKKKGDDPFPVDHCRALHILCDSCDHSLLYLVP